MLDTGGADKGLGNIAQSAGIAQPRRRADSSLQGFSYISAIGNANIGTQELFANTTFHYADNLTLIRGRHMMKMGGQALREWINVFYSGNDGRTVTSLSTAASPRRMRSTRLRRIGEADFMLGLPDDLGRGLQSGHLGPAGNDLGLLLPGRLAG